MLYRDCQLLCYCVNLISWSCRYYLVLGVCMFVCDGREAMLLGDWCGWNASFYVIKELISFSPLAVLHPCMSLCFMKMKKMIACFLLLFAHTLLSPAMAKDLPRRHFTRRRDVNTQSLLGELHTKKPKHHYEMLSQIQMIKGIKQLAKPWLT